MTTISFTGGINLDNMTDEQLQQLAVSLSKRGDVTNQDRQTVNRLLVERSKA